MNKLETNKSVKRVFAAVILLCFAFTLAACSGSKIDPNSKFIGNWKIDKVEAIGMSLPMNGEIEFMKNGKAKFTFEGDTQTVKWEEKDGGVVLKDRSDSMTGKMDGEVLVVTMSKDGLDMKIKLKKQ